ncbi:hypothetical protein P9D43_27695 [Neobacillus niacini]|uniref:hypothetical protein n=1 Tax=Neobacillus niacini TaxID=86668 RepID=UPI000AC42036|nr:hypothetical protein [Neobacillus niacini]MEC1525792.1 hypothetical protein [Neobacillus niacini]
MSQLHNGETAYKEVTQLFQNKRDTVYKVSTGNKVIEKTDSHPFWVEGKGGYEAKS